MHQPGRFRQFQHLYREAHSQSQHTSPDLEYRSYIINKTVIKVQYALKPYKSFGLCIGSFCISSYYNSSSVCSLCTPRSFDGSSPNLVGVCRLTSHLPLRGSFSKRSTGRRVNGSLSLSTISYMRQPHATRCNGVFCLASSRV